MNLDDREPNDAEMAEAGAIPPVQPTPPTAQEILAQLPEADAAIPHKDGGSHQVRAATYIGDPRTSGKDNAWVRAAISPSETRRPWQYARACATAWVAMERNSTAMWEQALEVLGKVAADGSDDLGRAARKATELVSRARDAPP